MARRRFGVRVVPRGEFARRRLGVLVSEMGNGKWGSGKERTFCDVHGVASEPGAFPD